MSKNPLKCPLKISQPFNQDGIEAEVPQISKYETVAYCGEHIKQCLDRENRKENPSFPRAVWSRVQNNFFLKISENIFFSKIWIYNFANPDLALSSRNVNNVFCCLFALGVKHDALRNCWGRLFSPEFEMLDEFSGKIFFRQSCFGRKNILA